MYLRPFVLLLGLLYFPLSAAAQSPLPPFEIADVPVYVPDRSRPFFKLEMSYAGARIQNPQVWQRWEKSQIHQIDLVFTQHPVDPKDWIIPYDRLLQRRMNALKRLAPHLLADSSISWRLVRQSFHNSRQEAEQMFHGFVIYTRPPIEALAEEVEKIATQEQYLEDSTAFNILQRHPEWKKKLIVMDWTGSMYPYGASVLLWHSLNLADASVSNYVFFNDGDLTPDRQKRLGRTRGVYLYEAGSIEDVLMAMREVMARGQGGDTPENDVEAILFGMQRSRDFEHIILIADNFSPVRDISLARRIGKPVHIILCGLDFDQSIEADYLTLAYQTGGSIHTLEDDIGNLSRVLEGKTIRIHGTTYLLRNGRFYPRR
ncbi:MAG: hypothetical protein AAFR61_18055 [Bacteroidota bacterium]